MTKSRVRAWQILWICFAFLILPISVNAFEKQKAADFTLKGIDGKTVTLSSLRGKVVLVNFWASWCPPCREEMPSLQKLNDKMKHEKFQMLTINVEKTKASAIKGFMDKNKYTFPVLQDPNGIVSSNYGIMSIPATFIIDKKGYIVKKVIGSFDWANEDVVLNIRRLIKE